MKNNNKGMSLVETIIGVALLAIASIMLVSGFVTTANIVNRATEYKIASAEAAGSVELQENIGERTTLTLLNPNAQVTFNIAEKNKEITILGNYVNCAESETGLSYQEFVSGNYRSVVVTEEVGE